MRFFRECSDLNQVREAVKLTKYRNGMFYCGLTKSVRRILKEQQPPALDKELAQRLDGYVRDVETRETRTR